MSTITRRNYEQDNNIFQQVTFYILDEKRQWQTHDYLVSLKSSDHINNCLIIKQEMHIIILKNVLVSLKSSVHINNCFIIKSEMHIIILKMFSREFKIKLKF